MFVETKHTKYCLLFVILLPLGSSQYCHVQLVSNISPHFLQTSDLSSSNTNILEREGWKASDLLFRNILRLKVAKFSI